MKRSAFVKILSAGLLLSVSGSNTPAPALAAGTPPTDADLERLALSLAIEALNRYGPIYGEPRFWPGAYALLQSYGLDASWPTAKKLGDRFYSVRDELIVRANALSEAKRNQVPPAP